MPFLTALEFKDWFLVVTFGITIITAWVKLRARIDRADEVHVEIKTTLTDLATTAKERHTSIKLQLSGISSDVGEIKTDVAVSRNEQRNLSKRIEKLEE